MHTFAVDCDGAWRRLADAEEVFHDEVAGGAAIDKEEVHVLEAASDEARLVIDLLVQANDCRDVTHFEVLKVRLRRVQRIPYKHSRANRIETQNRQQQYIIG